MTSTSNLCILIKRAENGGSFEGDIGSRSFFNLYMNFFHMGATITANSTQTRRYSKRPFHKFPQHMVFRCDSAAHMGGRDGQIYHTLSSRFNRNSIYRNVVDL